MRQASVGFHCPDCVKGSGQRVIPARQAVARPEPVVTYGLIAINVAVFLFTSRSGFDGAVSARAVAQGDWWRLLTAGFLHANPMHIGMNMFALWSLGRGLEPIMGHTDFTITYFGCLFAGSLGVVLSPNSAIGASGAIFGLLGLLAMMYASRGIPLGQSGLLGVLIINAGISFLPFVSWQGHLGGFIGGLAYGLVYFVWARPLQRINRYLPRVLGIGLMFGFLFAGYAASVALA